MSSNIDARTETETKTEAKVEVAPGTVLLTSELCDQLMEEVKSSFKPTNVGQTAKSIVVEHRKATETWAAAKQIAVTERNLSAVREAQRKVQGYARQILANATLGESLMYLEHSLCAILRDAQPVSCDQLVDSLVGRTTELRYTQERISPTGGSDSFGLRSSDEMGRVLSLDIEHAGQQLRVRLHNILAAA